jgi:hypothetical protein
MVAVLRRDMPRAMIRRRGAAISVYRPPRAPNDGFMDDFASDARYESTIHDCEVRVVNHPPSSLPTSRLSEPTTRGRELEEGALRLSRGSPRYESTFRAGGPGREERENLGGRIMHYAAAWCIQPAAGVGQSMLIPPAPTGHARPPPPPLPPPHTHTHTHSGTHTRAYIPGTQISLERTDADQASEPGSISL